jgi:hypothetical protein
LTDDIATSAGLARCGAKRLPSVDVESFNVELVEAGFLGQRN